MTLTTRLSLFFLAALAVVLVGFATTLYLLARGYLHRQVDDRLDAALSTLAAAADISPEGVEWEPHERQLFLNQDDGSDQLSWTVRDEKGGPLPQSPVLVGAGFLAHAEESLAAQPSHAAISYQGGMWRVSQRRVPAEDFRGAVALIATEQREAGKVEQRYRALVLIAAVSLDPVAAKLRQLAGVLSGLSLTLWFLAAVLGRRLCRRALAPLARMADAAGAISAANLETRLPSAGAADELDHLRRAFNELLARLQDSFERQRRFAGEASHQLRTPLTALLGQVEVALRRDRTAEDCRAVLECVQQQALGMRQIVEMLLFLARADAESLPTQLEAVDLTAWLDETRQRWSGQERAADMRVECPKDDSCRVETHAPLLRQLLDNLIENACKHTPLGTPIILRLWREGGILALTVEDAGPGIAVEDLPHIFEPFYRSAQARRRGIGGVGLGLAVAKRIAAHLGGDLSVENGPRSGARFTLRLQALAMDTDPLPHGARSTPLL